MILQSPFTIRLLIRLSPAFAEGGPGQRVEIVTDPFVVTARTVVPPPLSGIES